MIKKQSIQTQLECRATASLQDSIAQDLSKPDKPLAEFLTDTEDKDESTTENKHNGSN